MSDALRKKIVDFAKSKIGKKVGTGQCYELADEALKDAGAKTASDYGKITKDADYVWGKEVNVDKTLPGDIIQFRDYKRVKMDQEAYEIGFPKKDGGGSINYTFGHKDTVERPHHTAVASTHISQGKLTVLEQNVKRGGSTKEKIVRPGDYRLKSRPTDTKKSTPRVTINKSWADAVKKTNNDRDFHKLVDAILERYNGKSFQAKLTTTVKVSVSGKIWVYRAQPKP